MGIKLMVLDVDGTLTDEEGRVSPENVSAVRATLAAGVGVVLATGRPLQGVEPICRELGLSGPLILTGGSLILFGTEVWLEEYLTPEDLRRVFEHGLTTGNMAMFAFQPEIVEYWLPPDIDGSWILSVLDSFGLHRRLDVRTLHDLPLERVNKAAYMGNELVVAQALNTWPEELDHLNRGRSYPHVCEINGASANKGRALSVVCNRLGISPSEVLAIGDGETDLPMLRLAGKAVFIARSPGIPQLPEHAVVVTKKECNRGVAWAVANYLC